jgi:hypothetical protein
VRITASLLHDGDADIANAESLIGKRAQPLRATVRVARWIGALLATGWEALGSVFGNEPPGSAEWMGGPVLEGRKGGTFYVFLPGLPFLLMPSMALDSFVDPGRLVVTLLTCLALGALCTLLIGRLIEPVMGSRIGAYVLAFALGLTPPLFFYHFQIYTEVTATICVTLMIITVLDRQVSRARAIGYGLSGALLPWLHTKYLPIWGVLVLALAWNAFRGRRGPWLRMGGALGLACLGFLLQCLYVFHITGSLMPDALWVARGYPREATLLSAETLPGLYHLLVDRAEGLLVYAPLYVFVLPGAFSLRRKLPSAFRLGLAIAAPYLLAAASHDQGGAGAWAPPARYLVPLVPIMALCIAAWLSESKENGVRWVFFGLAVSAGFWIGQFMLLEVNFVYDRAAFLASGIVDPSAALGSVGTPEPLMRRALYPVALVAGLALAWTWERRGLGAHAAAISAAVLVLIVAFGSLASTWSEPGDWIHPRPRSGPIRVRGQRPHYVAFPECGALTPRLRLQGTVGSHAATVSAPGLERELSIPASRPIELPVAIDPVRIFGSGDRKEVRVLELVLHPGQGGIDVEAICR